MYPMELHVHLLLLLARGGPHPNVNYWVSADYLSNRPQVSMGYKLINKYDFSVGLPAQ